MKKIFVSLFALASMVTAASAQVERKTEADKQDRREMKESRTDNGKMKQHRGEAMKELNLSADQKQRMKSLNEDFKTKMQDLKKNDGISVKESRENRASLAREHQAQIQALLTSEQKAKLEQLKAEGKSNRMGDNGKGRKEHEKRDRHDGANLEKLKTELNLTDAQMSQLNSNQEKAKSEMRSIAQDQSLSKEQKKEKLETLKTQSKDSFNSILTDEQQKKMEELKNNRPARRKNA